MGTTKCPLMFISKHLQRLNFTITQTKEVTHCSGANARNDFKKAAEHIEWTVVQNGSLQQLTLQHDLSLS